MSVATTFIAVTALVMQSSSPQPLNVEKWIEPEDYPEDARQAWIEGRVEVLIEVAPDGRAVACEPTPPSVPILATATCSAIRERALFLPARDADGQAMTGRVRRVVAWQLPREPLRDFDVVLRADYDPKSASVRCRIVRATGNSGAVAAEEKRTCETSAMHTRLFGSEDAPRSILIQTQLAVDNRGVESLYRSTDVQDLQIMTKFEFVVTPEGHGERCAVIEQTGLYVGDPCIGLPLFEKLPAESEPVLREVSIVRALWNVR